ncbi:MAG: threonine synthase [Gammaproteobacteria bacterium]|nr:threonine synthase [Gammaproteobacteria bacterium]
MQFIETRGNDGQHPQSVPFSEAILSPISSFGGIYSPQSIPKFDDGFLNSHVKSNYKTLAKAVLNAFATDIDSDIIDSALALYDNFDDPTNPVPVVKVHDDLFVSELYHGPTRAFKDMALQPFGTVLSAIAQQRQQKFLILTATSGDTGPAALHTFSNKDNVQVACMYPDGGTSDVQRLQMVTEDAKNLKVIGIEGDFDDAQSALKYLLGKEAVNFKETLNNHEVSISAANSVNFGRIIFQIIYHIHSYLELVRQNEIKLGDEIYLNVPSGNFGNALGGFYAKKMGVPIKKIFISSNQNNVLTDFITNGCYDLQGKSVIATSSPAMDILKSSNVERILFDLFGAERTKECMQLLDDQQHYQLTDNEISQLQKYFCADFCNDEEVANYIKSTFEDGYLMDPHTATCFKAYQSCKDSEHKMVVYSTAEWTKFSPEIAKAITGQDGLSDQQALELIAEKAKVKIPKSIAALFDKDSCQNIVIDKKDIEKEILDFV